MNQTYSISTTSPLVLTDVSTQNDVSDTSIFPSSAQTEAHPRKDVFTPIVIALISACCVLFIVSLVAISVACRLWRLYCMKMPMTSWKGSISSESFKNDDVENNEVNETNENVDNISVEENVEEAETTENESIDYKLKLEEQEQTYSFGIDTVSLGLNTVAKREHKLDLHMQQMQQLFHAFGYDVTDHGTDTLNSSQQNNEINQEQSSTTNSQEHLINFLNDSVSSKPVGYSSEVSQKPTSTISKDQLADTAPHKTTKPYVVSSEVSQKPTSDILKNYISDNAPNNTTEIVGHSLQKENYQTTEDFDNQNDDDKGNTVSETHF